MINRQSEQIESLKSEIEKLNEKLEEKDKVINSIAPLRQELMENIADIKKQKEKYKQLIDELKLMKNIMNEEVYNNRWRWVRYLVK